MPLDPEVSNWIERQNHEPPRSSLTVEQTRAAYIRMSAVTGDRAPLAHVEDVAITPELCGRQYWAAADPALPILVWLHGGRFFSGSLETHDALCRKLALAGKCRILAVDYRLAPEHRFPAAVEDSLAAVEWALSESPRVGVGGDSAGGNLAAVAALLHTRAAPAHLQCQLLVYPMIDATCSLPSHREFASGYGPGSADMRRGWREYLTEGIDPRGDRVSPLFAENLAGLPPACVLSAQYDCLRDEGEEYARRLEQEGVAVSRRRYAGAIHGFFQMPNVFQLACEAINDAGAFLRSRL
ncbi:MAG: alpha/beta hydrolase [Terriglobia bacterium]